MQLSYQLPMCPESVVCPFSEGDVNHRIGVHSRKERRYKCHDCNKTFSETIGTPLYGLKTPCWVVVLVLTLLGFGCPVQAIVKAFGLDERTVTAWLQKAGVHGQQVQQTIVCNGQLPAGQVQGDEMWVKTQHGAVWMATAIDVFSRLFIWGAVSVERNNNLIERVVKQVKMAVGETKDDLLWVTDGFKAWSGRIKKVFRKPVYTGRKGRPKLTLPANIHVAQVVKKRIGRQLVGIERRLLHGQWATVFQLIHRTQIGVGVLNTAYVERLNATFRAWIPALTRRSRTPSNRRIRLEAAMFWTGVMYNFCRVHQTVQGSPAMAAGFTDHVWSTRALLFCFRFKRNSLHEVV